MLRPILACAVCLAGIGNLAGCASETQAAPVTEPVIAAPAPEEQPMPPVQAAPAPKPKAKAKVRTETGGGAALKESEW